MKARERLCRRLILGHLKRGEEDITSWLEFSVCTEWGIIGYDISHNRLLKAMAYGKEMGWLEASWAGVGMTPFAGSARRQRMYRITDVGKKAVKWGGEPSG